MIGSRVSERTSSRTTDRAMTRLTESNIAHQRAIVPIALVRYDAETGARILADHEERLTFARAWAFGRVPSVEDVWRKGLVTQLEDGSQPTDNERAHASGIRALGCANVRVCLALSRSSPPQRPRPSLGAHPAHQTQCAPAGADSTPSSGAVCHTPQAPQGTRRHMSCVLRREALRSSRSA
eukprot:scaffold232220_cov36-Tisochrysis_lutea.AAC.5